MTTKRRWTWILIFNLFNIMDAILTVYGVTKAGATELNPLMSQLLDFSIIYFFGIKLIIGILASIYFIKFSRSKLVKIITILFGIVVCWNIGMLITKFIIG